MTAINPGVFWDFEQFAPALLRISTKQKKLIKFRLKPLQVKYWREKTNRDLILKPRQVGFSTILQAENYWRVVTAPNTTLTLGKDDENTQMLRRMFQRYHEKFLGNPKPGKRLDNDKLSTFLDFESEALIATAGRVSAGRGSSLTFIHGSEVAFWSDAEELIAGALQAGNPRAVLESTPNGAQGYFYKLCMDALDGRNDWKLHFFYWWDEPEYQIPLEPGEDLAPYSDDELRLIANYGLTPERIKWRRLKKREVGAKFPQEYPENPRECFLLSGKGYFGNIDSCYLEKPLYLEPPSGHRIVGGLDFAQTNDYTVLSIGSADAFAEIALLRVNNLEWDDIRARIIIECKRWNVHTVLAEKNSIGKQNITLLRREAEERGCDTQFIGFDTTKTSKPLAVGDFYISLHERGLRLLRDENGDREMTAYIAKQTANGHWQYEAEGNENDDIVTARWLMNRALMNPGAIEAEKAPAILRTRR